MKDAGLMKGTGARRRKRFAPAAVTAACVTAVLVLGGCAHAGAQGNASTSAPASASASASAPASAPARGAGHCTADYCTPADWDTTRASTPLTQIAPFVEPLNVVISARSTVSLASIQQALGKWKTVSTATDVSIAGIHLKCISAERADVAGGGYLPQHQAWRLGGCIDGNVLSLSGNEDHVRIWNQPVPGSKYGAWFIAASYETMCLVHDGVLETASANKAYAVLHPGAAYHCVDGGPGSIRTAHSDGYNDAARDFTAAVAASAHGRGWQVSQRTVDVPRGARSGEGGVPFGPDVDVLTVTG
jgi:hypothetical protein